MDGVRAGTMGLSASRTTSTGNTMGVIIERAAAEEALRLLRHHGLSCGALDRVLRESTSLTEAEWEAAFTLLDPVAKEAMRRWLVPVVYHVVSAELERWHASVKTSPPLFDLAGVARRLNVSERTVERLVAEGLLTPLWVGGSRRFAPEGVDGFLKRYAIRGRRSTKKTAKRK
jgi:excisionase family DNA binding protein